MTRNCLKSIAANTDKARVEVIAIDNASSDATRNGCNFLGKQLFGDSFHYIRNEENRNFAGACNQGARRAQGEFVIFLNNDAEVQQGWYQPLIDDFSVYPDIAATGPVLVYPAETPLGRIVQHLGITLTPSMRLSHLYNGIPAASPLARKRRFFQAITGACFVIRRKLFLDAGGFDEGFINGFEDVDLCAKLWDMGMRMTVNPGSTVVHYESQTPGRYAHEAENSQRILNTALNILGPDWHVHLNKDGLIPVVDQWLMLQAAEPGEITAELDVLAKTAATGLLEEWLTAHPYWEKGWEELLSRTSDPTRFPNLFRIYFRLFKRPSISLEVMRLSRMDVIPDLLNRVMSTIRHCCPAPPFAYKTAVSAKNWCADIGLDEIAAQYDSWLRHYPAYAEKIYRPAARKFLRIAAKTRFKFDPCDSISYAFWLYGQPVNASPAPGIKFSLLMPVYNPKPEHLRKALDSILAQTCQDWELCLADDASTDVDTARIIAEYAGRDSRIRIARRDKNGHIAAATNTALSLANAPWCVLVDQDDELTPDALAAVADAIAATPGALLVYSDEDKTDDDGNFFNPHFKNGRWDWELLPAQNFVCHLAAYRTDRLREIGGFRDGFPGAQDHDLLLRYVKGLKVAELVHIPRILYHWRVHAQSTAGSIASKGYALNSARLASQEWLNSEYPGAVVEQLNGRVWFKVLHPLPETKPLVSIICDARGHFPTSWPCEIIRIENAGIDTLTAAARQAKGEIIGFLGSGVTPASRNWLEEIVRNLARPEVGAVAGKVTDANGRFAHGGYLVDAGGLPRPLFRWAENPAWFGWEILARTVDALDGLCLFTRKNIFMEYGALDPVMGQWAFQDYCLRLGRNGLRSLWWPFARFVMPCGLRPNHLPPEPFMLKWHGALPPFNRNVMIDGEGFSLCTG